MEDDDEVLPIGTISREMPSKVDNYLRQSLPQPLLIPQPANHKKQQQQPQQNPQQQLLFSAEKSSLEVSQLPPPPPLLSASSTTASATATVAPRPSNSVSWDLLQFDASSEPSLADAAAGAGSSSSSSNSMQPLLSSTSPLYLSQNNNQNEDEIIKMTIDKATNMSNLKKGSGK